MFMFIIYYIPGDKLTSNREAPGLLDLLSKNLYLIIILLYFPKDVIKCCASLVSVLSSMFKNLKLLPPWI